MSAEARRVRFALLEKQDDNPQEAVTRKLAAVAAKAEGEGS